MHNLILTIEQLLNLLHEELSNCVYNNTSDTNGKLTDNRWRTFLTSKTYQIHDIVSNSQKDYRQTRKTERRRS